jgi:hypothetical protein
MSANILRQESKPARTYQGTVAIVAVTGRAPDELRPQCVEHNDNHQANQHAHDILRSRSSHLDTSRWGKYANEI